MTITHENVNLIETVESILNFEKPTSILLIRGNRSYELCGAEEVLFPISKKYNVTELSGFKDYPLIPYIEKVIDTLRKKEIDFIIGIGGGTIMDIAKVASLLYYEKRNIEDYITGKQQPVGNSIKKILIPTTAGTGAEITQFSSVYIGLQKYSLEHQMMVPDYVVLAPELTYSLNQKITAQTGFDALAQAIEGFWSAKATKESKGYSRESISFTLENLQKAVNKPNPENRKAMLLGAHLAGKSISIAKTTAAHAISHSLMTHYNIPHGHAVMLTLPYFFPLIEKVTEKNVQEGLTPEYVHKTFTELLSILKVKDGREAKEMLLALADNIGLERKLSYFGVKEEELKSILDYINPKVKNNPIKFTSKIGLKILQNIL